MGPKSHVSATAQVWRFSHRGHSLGMKSGSQELEARSWLFFLRRQGQTQHGNPAFPRDIDFRVLRTGQIQRLAMLAAVDFGVLAPRFLGVATGLLDHIRSVEPALQVS